MEFLTREALYTEDGTVITDVHWQCLVDANREMLLRLETLQKVRAQGDTQEIKRVEMAYLQALQRVYDAAVDAVSDYAISTRK